MPYSYQVFTVQQSAAASQINMLETNIRDHQHGVSSVFVSYGGTWKSNVSDSSSAVAHMMTSVVSLTEAYSKLLSIETGSLSQLVADLGGSNLITKIRMVSSGARTISTGTKLFTQTEYPVFNIGSEYDPDSVDAGRVTFVKPGYYLIHASYDARVEAGGPFTAMLIFTGTIEYCLAYQDVRVEVSSYVTVENIKTCYAQSGDYFEVQGEAFGTASFQSRNRILEVFRII